MNAQEMIFDRKGVPRSGIRVAIFIVSWTLLSGVFGVVASGALRSSLGEHEDRVVGFALGSFVSLVSALVVGWVCGRWLEKLPYNSLGAGFTDGWLAHLFFGLAIGTFSLGLAVAIAAAFGQLSFELREEPLVRISYGLGSSFLILAFAAAFEEAFFRGYIFQTLARSNLTWLAFAVTAGFFGVVHIGNPGSGAISTANTILAGILFGVAYLKTQDLWFPFGLHLMWNWTQGSIFGIEVSGLTELSSVSIFREIDRGPEWLTGGSYGIEGGLACTFALLATTVFVYSAPFLRVKKESKGPTLTQARASGS